MGNLCTGSNKQVALAIKQGGLTLLQKILKSSEDPPVVREACWVLSNIAAGPTSHVQQLLDLGVIILLEELIRTSMDASVPSSVSHIWCR